MRTKNLTSSQPSQISRDCGACFVDYINISWSIATAISVHEKHTHKLVYTHTMIYRPTVPVFRNDCTTELLCEPYQVDIINAAPLNACKALV